MKPIIPSSGISRRVLLSAMAMLPALSAPLLSVSAPAQTAAAGRPAAIVERRPGEAGDRRIRAGATSDRSSPSSCRRRTASPRSTRTARSGSSIRCTRR